MINILFLGLVSFFTDISTEMVYPLIPLYLTGRFGATPALVGVVEGVAESTASLLKVFSGYLTDRFQKKKLIAFSGYAGSLFYKLALLLSRSWWGILIARVIDRTGKGIRTAPRDVLVSESAGGSLGKAFGLHKALDMCGAALGVLITWFLLRGGQDDFNYRFLFMISVIPAVLGLCMFLFVKQEPSPAPDKHREPFWQGARQLDKQLLLYLAVVFLFTLGNSSDAFLVLRARDAGFGKVSVILLYFLCNLTAAALSMPLGRLSDKIGRKKLLVPGYLAFAACYFGFAFARGKALMMAIFVLYGAYTAMITGVERAFVAEIAPPALKGTLLGLQATVAGVALLPASVIAGALYKTRGPRAPFVFGAALSLAAAVILMFMMKGSGNSPRPSATPLASEGGL
ncbi:MAG: MFS transporter [Firmicutes bacterium]|nr:MFS transporter [Bacillota bacterium]